MILNVSDAILLLELEAFKFVLNDDTWKKFGYSRRPKRGSFFNRFVSKEKFIKETFLSREFFCAAIGEGLFPFCKENNSEYRQKIVDFAVNSTLTTDDSIRRALRFESYNDAYSYIYNHVTDYVDNKEDSSSGVFIKHSKCEIGLSVTPEYICSVCWLDESNIKNFKLASLCVVAKGVVYDL